MKLRESFRRARDAWLAAPAPGRIAAVLVLVFLLGMCAGCTTAPRHIETKVPVPVECREAVPERPAMPTEQARPEQDIDHKTKLQLAEIETREAYETRLRAALEACTKPVRP